MLNYLCPQIYRNQQRAIHRDSTHVAPVCAKHEKTESDGILWSAGLQLLPQGRTAIRWANALPTCGGAIAQWRHRESTSRQRGTRVNDLC